ncbi:tyrosine-type recombinase/integrase [Paracoccus sp. IB05]|uniref:tyrosine-type recombinase/integrase n=1 Tax=Paracoccus sp. IB05 TaxID=2779367 RepID=UPI0018E7EDED|nr:tyrosine-type recombinase/integrase [Paracoccus sp. IB05]MBJ2150936.1 tyrosine-type recombinase/integrase [Paracoccus sp. IB05]
MKRALPAHVYQKPKGLYFQRRGWKTVKINAAPGTKEFAFEYAAILNGALVAPQTATGRTFAALIQSYHASPRYKGLAPRTARDYDKVLIWIKSKLGTLDVAGMQRKDVIRARDANAETVRFANYIVQVLRILFEHGIDQGWREDNPAKGVRLLKSGAPPREAWPQDMIDAYRAKAAGRALLIFELALGTGQRIGDVLKMRWSDIEGDGINVTQGKTGARRWVPFTARLRALVDATPCIGLTICAWGPPRTRPDLFPSCKGCQAGARGYRRREIRYSRPALCRCC